MINLIGNELKKIFAKWTVKIMVIIAIGLAILQAVILKFNVEEYFDSTTYSANIEEQIEQEKNILKTFNPEKESDKYEYVELKTNLDVLNLRKEYVSDYRDWKEIYIIENMYDSIHKLNTEKYITKNNENLKIAETEYNDLIKILEDNDWKTYTENTLKVAKEELATSKNMLKQSSEDEKANLEKKVELNELEVEVLELRLKKNIPYDYSYMNEALGIYHDNMINIIESENNDKGLKEETMLAKLTLDTEKDLRCSGVNATSQYKDYMENVGHLIVMLIVITTSGAIISEEFNKGTIKQLLIKPYRRTKIWMAKYITTIIVTIISFIIIGIIAALIFGIFMGFGDYADYKVGVYDYNTASAYSMNVFAYIGVIFISKMPYLIMLGTIAICVSTVLNNTALAVAVPLLGNTVASIINMILIAYKKFRFFKFFVTPNWDWSIYNFGKKPELEFLNFKFSVIVYMVWLLLFIGVAIYRLKKEDVKNI